MIAIKNFHKSYGKNIILDNLNLQLANGHILGFVGKNGAGKSTLFRCIAGLESYEGSITFKHKNDKYKIGFLETTPHVLTKITGWEYLQLLCNSRNIKLERSEKVNLFELPLKSYAENYSTGMLKKLAITGLLLQKNEIFILDEPFSGLDLESNIMLIAIIKTLKSKQKTVLISSHMLTGLYDICDQINFIAHKGIQQITDKERFKTLEGDFNINQFQAQLNTLL